MRFGLFTAFFRQVSTDSFLCEQAVHDTCCRQAEVNRTEKFPAVRALRCAIGAMRHHSTSSGIHSAAAQVISLLCCIDKPGKPVKVSDAARPALLIVVDLCA